MRRLADRDEAPVVPAAHHARTNTSSLSGNGARYLTSRSIA